jgi:hypothetical protein
MQESQKYCKLTKIEESLTFICFYLAQKWRFCRLLQPVKENGEQFLARRASRTTRNQVMKNCGVRDQSVLYKAL